MDEENRGFEPASENKTHGDTAPVAAQPTGPKRKTSGWRIFWGVVIALSVIANVVLFFMIVMMVSFAMSGPKLFDTRDGFTEEVLVRGPANRKIAVIRMEGIIDSSQSDKFRKQLKAARLDENVKAVIVRTITPGGTVSASDQMHNEIMNFRRQTGKPVVAFMQTVAASGGYYTSVACDKIIAEPTVITGSIGVIMNSLVIKELLEEKLGIQPVIIKSGPKKDWPSMFTETTQEQKDYLQEKLINPAYERFVNLVDQGREELSAAQVRQLADGSIYGADEARENKLIDQVGYFEDAVQLTEQMAGIRGAKVVEYTRLLTISALLGAEAKARPWEIDRNTLHELTMPQLLYLWDGGW
ncbi:MAG: signal peptide peptidase SppA [Phycisphaerae bacterium]|nr:signal peptide peptidase SppA [Phycisphaerae bacterium]